MDGKYLYGECKLHVVPYRRVYSCTHLCNIQKVHACARFFFAQAFLALRRGSLFLQYQKATV